MARHAGTVAGWAQDIGAARKRIAARRPKFGKHAAPQHAGATETRAMSHFMAIVRRVSFMPINGRHGINYANRAPRTLNLDWMTYA